LKLHQHDQACVTGEPEVVPVVPVCATSNDYKQSFKLYQELWGTVGTFGTFGNLIFTKAISEYQLDA
jgi:hypothetical protein